MPRKPAAKTGFQIPPSKSGRYRVELSGVHDAGGVMFKPGQSITVSRAKLEALVGEGKVKHAVVAD